MVAYGQTGSGKTHTMLGHELEEELLVSDEFVPTDNWYVQQPPSPHAHSLTTSSTPHRGVIPRAVDDLFLLLADHAAEGTTAIVHCAYMQIYNDKIYDLLQDR